MTMGNLYGVDVKLSPSNGKVEVGHLSIGCLPIAIELNGVDSGTDFFKYPEGMEYYRTFARVMGKVAEGKPVFIESFSESRLDVFSRIAIAAAMQKSNQSRKQLLARIHQIFGSHYDFDYKWLDDQLAFYTQSLEKPPEHEDSFYALGGQQVGVPIIPYESITFGNSRIEFRLQNGRSMRLRPSEVGLIRPSSYTLNKVPAKFQYLFLNTGFIEGVLDSKVLTWFASTFNNDGSPGFLEYLPPTMPYGLRMTDLESLVQFLTRIRSSLVVKKTGAASSGIGVEILVKKQVLEQLLSRTLTPISPEQQQALGMFILEHAATGLLSKFFDAFVSTDYVPVHLDNLVSVYQPFIPSIQISDPETGNVHDGCARVIVYSPIGSEPVVLGAQWRLAPKPLDNGSASLEDRFRANLSRGATAIPMEPQHEALVGLFAASLIRNFEATMSSISKRSAEERSELRSEFDKHKWSDTDLDWLRVTMFGQNILERLSASGAYDAQTGATSFLPAGQQEHERIGKALANLIKPPLITL